MENWLSRTERTTLTQLEPTLKYLLSKLNEFSRDFNHQKNRQVSNLICSHVDTTIDANLTHLHRQYQALLRKLGLSLKRVNRANYFTKTMTDMLALPLFCRNHPSSHPRRKAKHISRNQPRGPYRSYTTEEKQFVLNMHLLGKTFASISKELEIPQKNVVRWCREGLSGKPFNRRGSSGQKNSGSRQVLQDIGNVKLDEPGEDSEEDYEESEQSYEESNIEDTPHYKEECD